MTSLNPGFIPTENVFTDQCAQLHMRSSRIYLCTLHDQTITVTVVETIKRQTYPVVKEQFLADQNKSARFR